MKNNEPLRVVIAETSGIIRSGISTMLKRLPDLNIRPLEVTSIEALHDCFRAHTPDILIINPVFGGWFDINKFKEEKSPHTRCISLVCSVIDNALLKNYDDTISVYDDIDILYQKITKVRNLSSNEEDAEQESLSQREKEIIVCVVKGMTNKEIAEKLYLSIHTVITHRRNIARKLQIHSPSGLTIYAIVNKLVELQDIS